MRFVTGLLLSFLGGNVWCGLHLLPSVVNDLHLAHLVAHVDLLHREVNDGSSNLHGLVIPRQERGSLLDKY